MNYTQIEQLHSNRTYMYYTQIEHTILYIHTYIHTYFTYTHIQVWEKVLKENGGSWDAKTRIETSC